MVVLFSITLSLRMREGNAGDSITEKVWKYKGGNSQLDRCGDRRCGLSRKTLSGLHLNWGGLGNRAAMALSNGNVDGRIVVRHLRSVFSTTILVRSR